MATPGATSRNHQKTIEKQFLFLLLVRKFSEKKKGRVSSYICFFEPSRNNLIRPRPCIDPPAEQSKCQYTTRNEINQFAGLSPLPKTNDTGPKSASTTTPNSPAVDGQRTNIRLVKIMRGRFASNSFFVMCSGAGGKTRFPFCPAWAFGALGMQIALYDLMLLNFHLRPHRPFASISLFCGSGPVG